MNHELHEDGCGWELEWHYTHLSFTCTHIPYKSVDSTVKKYSRNDSVIGNFSIPIKVPE